MPGPSTDLGNSRVVGQVSIALAVGVGGVVWTFFLSKGLSFLSPSLWEID